MSSTTTVRAAIDEMLKIVYSEPLHNDAVTESELANIFDSDMNIQTDQTTGAKYVQMSNLFRLPAGVGARAEGEYLPEADDPVAVNPIAYLRKVQGTLEMSGEVMERVLGDVGSFINYADEALPMLATRVAHEMDRMYVGTGKGIRAVITSINVVGTEATVVVESPMGITGYTGAWLHFFEGERCIAADDEAATTIRTGGGKRAAQVTDFDEDSDTVIFTGLNALLATWTIGDYLFGGDEAGIGSVTAGGDNREVQGLFAAVDDGNIIDTYLNVQRSSTGNRLWKSVVIDAATTGTFDGLMSEDLLVYADDQSYTRGMAKVDTIVMSRSASRGYWNSLKGDRFYIDPRGNFVGGKNKMQVVLGDRLLDLKVARKLPPEVCFGLTRARFKRLSFGAWKWDDTTGSIWNRVTDATGRKHAYFGTGHLYEELICTGPRRNWRIDGLLADQSGA